jgi:FHA domain
MANERTKWVWTTKETESPGLSEDSLPPLPDGMEASGPTQSSRREGRDDERTSLYRPKPAEQGAAAEPARSFTERDPVTGWLVVVKGPGLGTSVNLGIGANSIGRDRRERVVLDFGDTMISRTNHATIVYDDRARAFFIQHGDGKNLTRVNDKLVTGFVELHAGDTIELGPQTSVRFVPFCGPGFCWADVV